MFLFLLVWALRCGCALSSSKKNVLFLIADDLRPELGAYGHRWMVTPALDKFAEESLVFDAAFTNFAICSPSRNSFLSGRMPDATRTWNFIDDFRNSGRNSKGYGADWVSLPQFFKAQGYTSLGHGKLYHPNKPPDNDPPSWSEPYVELTTTSCDGGLHYCPTSGMPNDSFSDFNTTVSAIERLPKRGKWFLGLGLHFPHLSWATPQWCTDVYNETDLEVSKSRNAPLGVPDVSFTAEIDGATHIRLSDGSWPVPTPTENVVPKKVDVTMRLGYYSAVTHTDWLLGKILDAAESQKSNTLVVVTGDHGYSLGEHGEWAKHSLFDNALRVPLMIRAPWISTKPRRTSAFFELIDLYRTMASLAGLNCSAIAPDVDGVDQSRVVFDENSTVREEAYAQYSRCPRAGEPAWYLNDCERVAAENITVMGFTVRTHSHRFTEWYSFRNCTPLFDEAALATELYLQQNLSSSAATVADFDAGGRVNVAPLHNVTHYRSLLRERFDRPFNYFGCP